MTEEYLFVYGTLRPECQQHSQHLPKGGNIAHDALQRYGEAMGQTIWQAQLFDLGRYPGAQASTEPTDQVIGELFQSWLVRPLKTKWFISILGSNRCWKNRVN